LSLSVSKGNLFQIHGGRHPGRFAEEELCDRRSENEEREDIQSLMDAGEYDNAAKLANEAIAETVARYIHEAMLEKEEQQEEIAWSCFEEMRQPSRGQMKPAPEPCEVETLKRGFAAERRERSRRLGIISPGTQPLYLRQAIPQRPKMMGAGATESAPRNRLARGLSKGCRHRTPIMCMTQVIQSP
jgi:hypothetical protein